MQNLPLFIFVPKFAFLYTSKEANPSKKQKKEVKAAAKKSVEAVSSKWEDEDSLPEGWKMRRLHKAGVGEVIHISLIKKFYVFMEF